MEIVKNFMEELVEVELTRYLEKRQDVCSCEKCKNDMRAFALNKLNPHYVVTTHGYLFQKMEEMQVQFNVDVLKSVVKAVEIVSKNPRHDDE